MKLILIIFVAIYARNFHIFLMDFLIKSDRKKYKFKRATIQLLK
jgi:hypothetical protein